MSFPSAATHAGRLGSMALSVCYTRRTLLLLLEIAYFDLRGLAPIRN
jgi:hypothetical protein